MKKFGIFVLLGCMLFSGCGNKDSSENQSNVEMTPAVTQAVTTPALPLQIREVPVIMTEPVLFPPINSFYTHTS